MEAAGDRSDRSGAQATGSSSASKLLRYPLRSASRSKEIRPPTAASANAADAASVPRRGRSSPAVSKSLSVLEFSTKDKTAKPPRARPSAIPHLATAGSTTPKPETNTKSSKDQWKSITPLSDALRSSSARKFNAISSVSYWLAQIKLSESASKHSISLGFFKLALESGCEPFDRVQKELKSYIKRHNLGVELQEPLSELLQSYNIVEDLEKLSVSETFPNLTEDGVQKSKEETHSLSSNVKTIRLTAEVLNKKDTPVAVVNANDIANVPRRQRASKSRGGNNKNDANTAFSKVNSDNNMGKKPRKANKHSLKVPVNKSSVDSMETDGSVSPQPTEEVSQDKENMQEENLKSD